MREKRFTEEQIIARPTRPSPRSPGAVIVASTIEWTPDDMATRLDQLAGVRQAGTPRPEVCVGVLA
jgi:hypothetical protein